MNELLECMGWVDWVGEDEIGWMGRRVGRWVGGWVYLGKGLETFRHVVEDHGVGVAVLFHWVGGWVGG